MIKKGIFIVYLISNSLLFGQSNEALKLTRSLKLEAKINNEKLDKLFSISYDAKSSGDIIDNQKKSGNSRRFTENNITYEAVGFWSNGDLKYYSTRNLGGAKTIGIYNLNNGLNNNTKLNGEGIKIGIWDASQTKIYHPDFNSNNIIKGDYSSSNLDDHSTHVSGTVIGIGNGSAVDDNNKIYNSKGMANQTKLYTYDWTNDFAEMSQFANNGGLVSNHSYGPNGSSENDKIWMFGNYEEDAQKIDKITHINPYYQPVIAVGNDRGKGFNLSKNGYDLLLTTSTAKNAIIVGAVEELEIYKKPSDVRMSYFSNWGPTDDGRIKPDIVSKGVNVYSAIAGDKTYAALSGSSMASPAIASGLLLLQQYYKSIHSKHMLSSTLRGLLLHTAKEAGGNEGPDYKFGWGLADFESAASIINPKNKNIIQELTLKNGAVYSKGIDIDPSKPLRISISWTDPEGKVMEKKEDVRTRNIVHDLDIEVIDDKNNRYYPWKLDPLDPDKAATNNSSNNVDNFERIDINNPKSKNYTITVFHKNILERGSQDYSLIISNNSLADLGESIIEVEIEENIKTYPNPVKPYENLHIISKYGGKYEIYDFNGRLVKKGNLTNGYNSINTESLKKNTYILRIKDVNKTYKQKIIIL